MEYNLKNKDDLKKIQAELEKLDLTQKEYEIIVNATRTASQNATYRWYLRIISKQIEISVEELHEHFKDNILINITNKTSTAKLNTVEFGKYLELIRLNVAEVFGLVLPDNDKP